MTDYAQKIAQELNLKPIHVSNAIALIDEGNTIPFIARYRKEATDSMDDQLLRQLGERLEYLRGLDKRKDEVSRSITEQGAMTEQLAAELEKAATLAEVEDLYRPYKPKRKTRASMAKAKGLEPLAQLILAQNAKTDPEAAARDYLNEQVADTAEALQGARDIIAETVSDDARCRAELRRFYHAFGQVRSVGAKEEDSVYSPYYDFSEPVSKIAGHRVLALNRGEREGYLKVNIEVDPERAGALCARLFAREKTGGACAQQVLQAALDAYKRLIHPSLDTEIRAELTDAANEGAITVFGDNLRQLLLQPPIKGKVALGLDPGYRMGCKVAVVDATGKVLDTTVIYPVPEFKRVEQAKKILKDLIKKHGVQIIAIGNGTASKETEMFAADVIREIGGGVQDPLAELVKIEPKAVGVGQYQHDMPQKWLEETLDGVVEDCVNSVGVDLNTASAPLLSRVAGITGSTAKNIVAYREEQGEFTSRAQLKKVKGLGPKAFEQCAGFLRLPNAKNKLDETAVHPESYAAAKALLELCGFTLSQIGTPEIQALPAAARALGWDKLTQATGAGRPTLEDIMAELLKPGRDMRDSLPKPLLRSDVMGMEDLKPGMELTGTVRNVIDFGAFVDIGVHQDGLVHISQICEKFIKHPREVLKVGDVVQVKVLDVDVKKKRISLTCKGCGNSF